MHKKKWSANLGGRELHLDATDWKFRDQSPLTRCHGDSKVGINSQPRKKTDKTDKTDKIDKIDKFDKFALGNRRRALDNGVADS